MIPTLTTRYPTIRTRLERKGKGKEKQNSIDRVSNLETLSGWTAIIPVLIWLRPTRIPASDRIYIYKTTTTMTTLKQRYTEEYN